MNLGHAVLGTVSHTQSDPRRVTPFTRNLYNQQVQGESRLDTESGQEGAEFPTGAMQKLCKWR